MCYGLLLLCMNMVTMSSYIPNNCCPTRHSVFINVDGVFVLLLCY